MTSPAEATPEREALEAARALSPAPVHSVSRAAGGANSRIWRVDSEAGPLALKAYPRRTDDPRDRQDAEWRCLAFLRAHGVSQVPAPIARDAAGRFLLMEWIEGETVGPPTERDLDDALAFLANVFALSDHPEAHGFPPASEACLSAAAIVTQIKGRLAALSHETTLDGFLSRDFAPAFDAAQRAVAKELTAGAALPAPLRRLIPADFGFHNALRQAGGGLRYVDFDYFGWDDPAKLAADIVLHPAMRLTEAQRDAVVDGLAAALPADGSFRIRLSRHLPLYALRWALIVLNPFRVERRTALPRDAAAREALLAERLTRARRLLELERLGQ